MSELRINLLDPASITMGTAILDLAGDLVDTVKKFHPSTDEASATDPEAEKKAKAKAKRDAKKAADKEAADKEAAEEADDGLGEDEPSGPTADDVRAALKEYAALEDKAAAIKILKDVGKAPSIGELDESNYQAVIDACN